jgi:ComF family protein
MGTQMAHCVNDRYSDINFDVVTFVPLTRKRKRSRGYNQSQLLANQISKTLDIPCKTLLKKVVSNRPQRSMRGNERRGNVFGVYDIVPNVDVTGKTILIVDDVKTTGSTVGECCATLKAYGANKVYAVTFAIR